MSDGLVATLITKEEETNHFPNIISYVTDVSLEFVYVSFSYRWTYWGYSRWGLVVYMMVKRYCFNWWNRAKLTYILELQREALEYECSKL